MSYSFHQISENATESFEDITDLSETLIQQVGSSDFIPEYNLAELGLEDYEPNELVLNIIHDLKLFFNNKNNCSCRNRKICFEEIGFKNFFERYLEMKGLENEKKDLCIKVQLMVFEFKKDESKSITKYKYQYNSSIYICQKVFLKLCNIGENKLSDLQTHLQNNGLYDRLHGNLKNVPRLNSRAAVTLDTAIFVEQFKAQYANIHGLPSPLRIQDSSDPFIYLPTDKNIFSIYKDFKYHLSSLYLENNQSEKIISYETFRKLWHGTKPIIKFQTHASDLCDTCENFRIKLRASNNEDEQVTIKFEYEEHVSAANLERQHYNNIIDKSKNDPTITHICYDWAQSVGAPYSPQQVGAIYFKSPFIIHLFGICKTDNGENHQLNFTIGEDEMPEGTSKKGANTTLNMVYHFLKTIGHVDKKDLYVTCDNCSGQNKNNLSLCFWSWLAMLGWYENIYINFMIPGHTKFICDSFCGFIKKKYRDRCINIVDDVEKAINDSSRNNGSIRYNNGSGWSWYDFNSMLEEHFRNLPNIRKYHHFRFSSLNDDIGKVYVSKKLGDPEICFKLLKNTNFDKNSPLNTLGTAPLTDKQKRYLYTNIRQHVDIQYRDILCPEPN